MRTICVTGKGRIKLKPDVTRITLALEGVRPEYSEALRCSSQDAERLREMLAGFGFERSALKTLSFDVDTEYDSYKEKGVYKQRLAGYKFCHCMKIEFPSDNDRLGRLLCALANCPERPELRLSYTVGDPEAAKNELTGRAVADAMGKAAVLAQAAGVRLKDIQNIDYSRREIDFEVRPVNRVCAPMVAESESYDLGIEPDDIDAEDSVTVIWEIE